MHRKSRPNPDGCQGGNSKVRKSFTNGLKPNHNIPIPLRFSGMPIIFKVVPSPSFYHGEIPHTDQTHVENRAGAFSTSTLSKIGTKKAALFARPDNLQDLYYVIQFSDWEEFQSHPYSLDGQTDIPESSPGASPAQFHTLPRVPRPPDRRGCPHHGTKLR